MPLSYVRHFSVHEMCLSLGPDCLKSSRSCWIHSPAGPTVHQISSQVTLLSHVMNTWIMWKCLAFIHCPLKTSQILNIYGMGPQEYASCPGAKEVGPTESLKDRLKLAICRTYGTSSTSKILQTLTFIHAYIIYIYVYIPIRTYMCTSIHTCHTYILTIHVY